MKILILCDNFLVGGRETYIKCYLTALSQRMKVEAALLSDQIEVNFVDDIFQEVYSIQKYQSSDKQNLTAWLKQGKNAIDQFQADVIWVHHYSLLPAWLLALYYDIPLLSTFHGSLLKQARLEQYHDKLGLACILRFGGQLSAVSNEIIDQINTLSGNRINKQDIRLLINAVDVPEIQPKQIQTTPIDPQIIVLTRQQKLGHLRAAVLLFCEVVRQFPGAGLTIYVGTALNVKIASSSKRSIVKLLGRKWTLRHFKVLKCLQQIKLKPLSNNSQQVIRQSEIVFAMGRVALEAIANQKPTVLVGYQEAVSLIRADNFKSLQYSNFSGRKQCVDSLKKIVVDINEALSSKYQASENLSANIDIQQNVVALAQTLSELESNSIGYWQNVPPNVLACVKDIFINIENLNSNLQESDIKQLAEFAFLEKASVLN